MRSAWRVTGAAIVVSVAWAATAAAASEDYAPGEVIVVYDDAAISAGGVGAKVQQNAGVKPEQELPANAQLVTIVDGDSVEATVAELKADPRVKDAFPNYRVQGALLPDEPDFFRQWGLHNYGQHTGWTVGANDADINAPAAWDMTTGSPNQVVAVVDSGIDFGHSDLSGAIWTNPGEIGSGRESNGRDDDGNGLIDDYRGWDYVDGDNNPTDLHGHGTHVSGILAGRPNNGGIVGVDWQARILPLRVLDANNYGYYSWFASAFDHAGRMGVRVVNASLGGTAAADWINTIIASHPDTLYVVAAMNDSVNIDASFRAPCALPAANVLCVAATNYNDGRASFSNYGPTTVDMGAPGEIILSALPGMRWDAWNGTSMATPMVSGAASLVLGLAPRLPTSILKSTLMSTGRALGGLSGLTVSGRRLDAAAAVATVYPARPPVLRSGATPRVVGTARIGEELTADEGGWDGGTPLDYTRRWERCNANGSGCQPISGAWTYRVTSADAGHRLRITATVSNYWGESSAASAPTPLIMAPPSVTQLPRISGAPLVGATLGASLGEWNSLEPPSLTARWERCTMINGGCATAHNGTSSYTTTTADLNQYLRLIVTATNAGGSSTATSPSVFISSAPPPTPPESGSGPPTGSSGGDPGSGTPGGGSGNSGRPERGTDPPTTPPPVSEPTAAAGGATDPIPSAPAAVPQGPAAAPVAVEHTKRTSGALRVEARINVPLTGRVHVRLTVRVNGRTIVARRTVKPRAGRIRVSLALPKAARQALRRRGGQITIVGTPSAGRRQTLVRHAIPPSRPAHPG